MPDFLSSETDFGLYDMTSGPAPFSVREAVANDREELGRLWTDFLKEQASLDDRLGVAADALDRWQNDFLFWLKDKARKIFVAARDDNTLIGFITAHRWSPPPIYREAMEVYIDEIYIVGTYRNRGVGTGLISAVKDWAEEQKVDRIRVAVLEHNKEGLDFWERQGASPFSRILTIELESERVQDKGKSKKLGF